MLLAYITTLSGSLKNIKPRDLGQCPNSFAVFILQQLYSLYLSPSINMSYALCTIPIIVSEIWFALLWSESILWYKPTTSNYVHNMVEPYRDLYKFKQTAEFNRCKTAHHPLVKLSRSNLSAFNYQPLQFSTRLGHAQSIQQFKYSCIANRLEFATRRISKSTSKKCLSVTQNLTENDVVNIVNVFAGDKTQKLRLIKIPDLKTINCDIQRRKLCVMYESHKLLRTFHSNFGSIQLRILYWNNVSFEFVHDQESRNSAEARICMSMA